MGYKEDVTIDINNLDAELLRQASLFQYWGRQEAQALYEKDQVEEALSKCKARVELDIRKDPEKYGYINKLTEGAISCLLVGQQEVIDAIEVSLKSKYKAKILNVAVKSFEHKKKALEKLVELYINGYWATPKVDPEAQRAFDDQAQKVIHKTMKGDERMMGLAKKKEDERVSEKKKKDTVDKKKKDAALRSASKKSVAEKEKTKRKTEAKGKSVRKGRDESKPTGAAKEQTRTRPKLRTTRKKK